MAMERWLNKCRSGRAFFFIDAPQTTNSMRNYSFISMRKRNRTSRKEWLPKRRGARIVTAI